MELAIAWFLFAFLVAAYASKRNRSPVGWFVLSAILSPLIAGLLLAIIGDAGDGVDRTPCPFCMEPIIVGALKCKHCGSDLNAAAESDDAPPPKHEANRKPSKHARSLGLALGRLVGRISK